MYQKNGQQKACQGRHTEETKKNKLTSVVELSAAAIDAIALEVVVSLNELLKALLI